MNTGKPGPHRVRMLARRSKPATCKFRIPWLVPVFAVGALFIFGTWTNFFVSERWSDISTCTAIVVSLALALLSVRAIHRSDFGSPAIRSNAIRLAVALVLVPTIAMFTIWVALADGLPDLITRARGTPFVESHELRTVSANGYRSCAKRVFGAPFERGSPNGYYCAGSDEFSRLPERGLMNIHGRQSWFGKHVDRIEPVDPALHR
jgi:hypothetical protein